MILDQINYEQLLISLNKFYDLYIGGSRRPVFFDISTTRPELLDLDRNYHVIREERLIRLRPVFPESVIGWLPAATGLARDLVAQAVGCVPIVAIPVGKELSSSLFAGQIAIPADRHRGHLTSRGKTYPAR